MLQRLSALLCLLALTGCIEEAGRGRGWVGGSLWVASCKSGEALGPADDFDLHVDAYFGDPLFDTSSVVSQRQSRLTLRLQETSSNLEETNGVVLQFLDLVQAAQAFAARQPIPFTDDSLCPGCTDINTSLRMQMYLYVRCPDNDAPLTAGVFPLQEADTSGTARQESCLLPDPAPTTTIAACPQLSAEDQAQLDALCEGDFGDRSQQATIEQLLGTQGACLYLCELGKVQRGDDASKLLGYEVDYGDVVSALFSTAVVDTRAVRLNRCAGAVGHLTGMFRFRLVRSRVAQPFP